MKKSLPILTERRSSLRVRVSGSRAIPISVLVERGTRAATGINAGFPNFARQTLLQLGTLLDNVIADGTEANWLALKVAVMDFRSSSATGQQETLSRLAQSWENVLALANHGDAKLQAAMRLHLDALRYAIADVSGASRVLARLEELIVRLNEMQNAQSRPS